MISRCKHHVQPSEDTNSTKSIINQCLPKGHATYPISIIVELIKLSTLPVE